MKIKPKKCKVCNSEFTPFQSTQKVCGINCAISHTQAETARKANKEAKEQRKRTREQKIALKTRREWLKECQVAVNAYVRLRDRGMPCISCDKPDNGQHQRHASHFKSVGSNSALRFNLWNIHASCSVCNNHLSGNIGEYIPRLINKIGQEKYDWLCSQNHLVRYDIEYLKRLKKLFNKRVRVMKSKNK